MDIARARGEFRKRGWYLGHMTDDEVKDLANNTLIGNRVLLDIAIQDLKEAWELYRSMIKILDWLLCKIHHDEKTTREDGGLGNG